MIAADMPPPVNIILASSSSHRRFLLQRLGLEFRTISPDIDESPMPEETPVELVRRLALAKAVRVAEEESGSLIIGSDQVAELDGEILTKPGDRDRARGQLRFMSGKAVCFYTGLCVLNTLKNRSQVDCISTSVQFRDLRDEEIERYLDREAPYDCAGAFKSERLGIALTRRIESADSTALIGLPLIRLTEMLREEGIPVP